MMIAAAIIGWSIGYAIAAATRTEDGPALYVPIPARLRRLIER
jgi:hypothetical protein